MGNCSNVAIRYSSDDLMRVVLHTLVEYGYAKGRGMYLVPSPLFLPLTLSAFSGFLNDVRFD